MSENAFQWIKVTQQKQKRDSFFPVAWEGWVLADFPVLAYSAS